MCSFRLCPPIKAFPTLCLGLLLTDTWEIVTKNSSVIYPPWAGMSTSSSYLMPKGSSYTQELSLRIVCHAVFCNWRFYYREVLFPGLRVIDAHDIHYSPSKYRSYMNSECVGQLLRAKMSGALFKCQESQTEPF